MDTQSYFDVSGKRIAVGHHCDKDITINGYKPHTHDTWELIFIKHGRVSYQSEGKYYTAESGNCILTRPGIRHTIRFLDTAVYDRYVMLLTSPLFAALPELPEVIDLGNNQIVQERTTAMVEAAMAEFPVTIQYKKVALSDITL